MNIYCPRAFQLSFFGSRWILPLHTQVSGWRRDFQHCGQTRKLFKVKPISAIISNESTYVWPAAVSRDIHQCNTYHAGTCRDADSHKYDRARANALTDLNLSPLLDSFVKTEAMCANMLCQRSMLFTDRSPMVHGAVIICDVFVSKIAMFSVPFVRVLWHDTADVFSLRIGIESRYI